MATVAKSTRVTTVTLGSSSAGPFNIGFRLFDDDGVDVYINGVATTAYTLSATYVDGYTDSATLTLDSAASTSDVIRIESNLVPDREEDYSAGEPQLTGKLNVELARIWASISDLHREVHRSPRVIGGPLGPLGSLAAGYTIAMNDDGDGFTAGPAVSDITAAEGYASAAEASATAAAAAQTAAEAAENSLLEWQGPWVTATAYAPSDLVSESGNTYVCITAHTSGTFATDLGAGRWQLFAQKGATGAGSGDLVAANNLSDVSDADAARANLEAFLLEATSYTSAITSITESGMYKVASGATGPAGGPTYGDDDMLIHADWDADAAHQLYFDSVGGLWRGLKTGGSWSFYSELAYKYDVPLRRGNDIGTDNNSFLIGWAIVTDGTSSGFTVYDEHGITVTRNSNGNYTCTFGTPRSAVDYGIIVQPYDSSFLTWGPGARTTSSFTITIRNSGTPEDRPFYVEVKAPAA